MNFARLLRCLVMDAFVSSAELSSITSIGEPYSLGTRCLYERASRRLDGEIYCAIHNVTDWNPLLDDQQLRARENGQVCWGLVPATSSTGSRLPHSPQSLNMLNPCCLMVFALCTATPEKYAPRHCRRGPSRVSRRR